MYILIVSIRYFKKIIYNIIRTGKFIFDKKHFLVKIQMGNINLRIPFCTLDFCQYPRHILGGKIEG